MIATRWVILIAIVFTVAVGHTESVQAQGASDQEAAQALERTLVEVIAQAEQSVVAISRAKLMPARPERPQTLRLRINARGIPEPVVPNPVPPNPLAPILNSPRTLPPHAHGAGVLIGDGLVLTQYLVVDPSDAHIVTDINGVQYPAEIRAMDPRSGLAVLAIKEDSEALRKLPSLTFGHAEDLRKGQFVIAIGNPFAIQSDGQATASWGMISNTARKAPLGENLNNAPGPEGSYRTTLHHFGSLIQTDARLGWNASGGALVTLGGKLVGITTTASTIVGHERPAGYAIPMNEVMRRVVSALREGREPEYGLLGIAFNRTSAASPSSGEPGIIVSSTYRGSPADQAGLMGGDFILRIAGKPTIDPDSLQLVVNSLAPGSIASVEFERGGQPQETDLRLGKAHVPGERVVTNRPKAWRGLRVDFATAVPANVLQVASREGRLDPEGCVVVTEVEEGSISWKSGVRPYAYISHVGGERVASPEDFAAAIEGVSDNVKIRFTQPVTPPANQRAAAFALPPAAPVVDPLGAPLRAHQQAMERRLKEIERFAKPAPVIPVPMGPAPAIQVPAVNADE